MAEELDSPPWLETDDKDGLDKRDWEAGR